MLLLYQTSPMSYYMLPIMICLFLYILNSRLKSKWIGKIEILMIKGLNKK